MKLFYQAISPPARAALLGFRNLDLNVELINLDLLKGEHLRPEFMKLNPAHQIPVLVDDDGFVLCESRAILGYLVNRFRPESSLYPADARKRALIDQKLYYDTLVFERNGQAIVS
jgi:glutathione S-transferase